MSTAAEPALLAPRLRESHVALRAELEVSRHVLQGQATYVLRDPTTFQSHAFASDDYQVLCALDQQKELQTVFSGLVAQGAMSAAREEDFYGFIVHLHRLGLLSLPIGDGRQLHERYIRRLAAQRSGWMSRLLYWKIPLWQPDSFLDRTRKLARGMFTRTAFALWLLMVALAVAIVVLRWSDFRASAGELSLARDLPLLWLLLAGLKGFHELGHACACKRFGGNVPEIGVNLILGTPCAYVDASAAWGFTSRLQRVVVSLAGMYYESWIAFAALAVWCLTEPSLVHSAAYYTVTIATVVTMGFNLNPLVRYDGYYVLTDLLSTSNLGPRSTQFVRDLTKHVLFGVPRPAEPRRRAARCGLLAYGVASMLYRCTLLIAIGAMLARSLPALGFLAAVVYFARTAWTQGRQLMFYLKHASELAGRRRRAVTVSASLAVTALVALTLVPAPRTVHLAGVVQRETRCVVRAEVPGFLVRCAAESGERIERGRPLCSLDNSDVKLQLARYELEQQRLGREYLTSLDVDRQHAGQTRLALRQVEQQRELFEWRREQLTICAPQSGEVVTLDVEDHVGQFVPKGTVIGRIESGPWTVRALATADDLLSGTPRKGQVIEIRLEGRPNESYAGHITYVASAGSRNIDSKALTNQGGGEIVVQPGAMEAAQPFFEIVMQLDSPARDDTAESSDGSKLTSGMTAMVKYTAEGDSPSLGTALYRRVLRFMQSLRAAGS